MKIIIILSLLIYSISYGASNGEDPVLREAYKTLKKDYNFYPESKYSVNSSEQAKKPFINKIDDTHSNKNVMFTLGVGSFKPNHIVTKRHNNSYNYDNKKLSNYYDMNINYILTSYLGYGTAALGLGYFQGELDRNMSTGGYKNPDPVKLHSFIFGLGGSYFLKIRSFPYVLPSVGLGQKYFYQMQSTSTHNDDTTASSFGNEANVGLHIPVLSWMKSINNTLDRSFGINEMFLSLEYKRLFNSKKDDMDLNGNIFLLGLRTIL